MKSFFALVALPLLASAWSEHTFMARSTGNATDCASGDKACGAFCIPTSYTCCPDLEGGCAATATCQLGDNDVYGCCPQGENCSGDGGAEFLDDESGTITQTAGAAVATKTGTSTSGADNIKFSSGLVGALAAAGVLALL